MDSALCASLHVLDDVDCNMPCVCENASMSVYPHAYNDMLHESLGVVKFQTSNSWRKSLRISWECEQVHLWKWWFDS